LRQYFNFTGFKTKEELYGQFLPILRPGSPASSAGDSSFVTLSENEVKVKTYHCTTLKRPRGEGYLTVTNKRVVFHAYGTSAQGQSKLVSEVPIETVSAIRTYYGSGAMGTPINLGAGSFGADMTGQGAAMSVMAQPTSETEMMMNELGAMILDFKSMGDHAIDKWLHGKKVSQATPAQQVRSSGQPVSAQTDDEFFQA